MKPNFSFGMALDTYMRWYQESAVSNLEIDRFFRLIRESKERDKSVSVGSTLATYCDWMFHVKIDRKNHVEFVKSITGEINSFIENKGVVAEGSDANEWIREIFIISFQTRNFRADIVRYFEQFGCRLDDQLDHNIVSELTLKTVIELAEKTVDIGGSFLKPEGKIDEPQVIEFFGAHPRYIVSGISVHRNDTDSLYASALLTGVDGTQILLKFPVLGKSIDHRP